MAALTRPSLEKPLTILVADDSPTQRALWIYSLGDKDAQVVSAEEASRTPRLKPTRVVLAKDGREAASILEHEEVELMVTDLDMPGLDGWSLVQRARQNAPHLGVLVVSSRVQTGEQPPAHINGGSTFLFSKADRDLAVNFVRRFSGARAA